MRLEELSTRRKQIWKTFEHESVIFDHFWRLNHATHQCESKVFSYTGRWFCEHLERARNNQFKEQLAEEERVTLALMQFL